MLTFSKLGDYGRFGNQLFQIASTIGIATKNDQTYGFPKWKYQEYFKNPLPIFDSTITHVIEETTTKYKDIVLDKSFDLRGYYQSYKYFDHCNSLIRYYFMFSEPDALVRACAVHVRRGDYVSLSHIHPNLSPDYYRRAMNLFPKDTPFLVMSDDINWCVNNINFADKDIVFFYNDEINSFRVMSQCEHNIISASSFSWWAAYLNKNPNKRVIAPSVWAFNEPKETIEDRLPPDWERLEL